MYGLDHAALNQKFPPKSMWMNMGYWEGNDDDFPRACETLLLKILDAAGLLVQSGSEHTLRSGGTDLYILDLGFGCGDQTLALVELYKKATVSPSQEKLTNASRLVYNGITLNEDQFRYAAQRLRALGPSAGVKGPVGLDVQIDGKGRAAVRILLADAANPSTWSDELGANSESLFSFGSNGEGNRPSDTWVLGLDTLYHFSPSRVPVLSLAHDKLNASLMAFDLLLGDNVSMINSMFLRVLSYFMGSPFGNLKTIKDYTKMLTDIGYESNKIEVVDVSQHVFGPLTKYIHTRDTEMKRYGLGGMGKFKSAASVFNWWAKSGVIRGCIVIARV